jgi:hypothetical protein
MEWDLLTKHVASRGGECNLKLKSVPGFKSLTSKGSRTNPRGKRCPTQLLPWTDFFEMQKDVLRRLYSVYPPDSRRDFENLVFLRGLGQRVARRKVGDEKALESVQHDSVETPVAYIIDCLRLLDEPSDEFNLGGGITFANHPNALGDEPRESQELLPPERFGFDSRQLRADQICVYTSDKDSTRRRLAFIVEYKAPHKLTLPHLRLGLREMNIYNDVVNRVTRPHGDNREGTFQYNSDQLVAAAVAQTFHYMIEGGLEYSYCTSLQAKPLFS